MASFSDQDEVVRSVSEAPPTHYTVKIESFSLLAKHSIDKYETESFEAGGYKWKLALYPNGNKNKNVKDHVSLHLALADTGSLRPGWEVWAVFRLYLLDQNKDSYTILQGNERRFHTLKREWGFDKFISIGEFYDASNGFLLEDTCVLGADVFVSKERSSGRGECLSMIKDPSSSKHVWRVDNVSKLDKNCYFSDAFFSGDRKWKIQLYPKGTRQGTGSHVSVYLVLAEPETLPVGTKLFAEFTIRMFDQLQGRHIAGKATNWFSEKRKENGWMKYVSVGYFNQPSSGLLLKDVCLLEADVCLHGIVAPL
ncbi:PREDICTED: MATH domain and coiled-coil domain-containing protein At3g27040 [Tarenaya hassleriana]|uniref:MATH domain and coiled-coil domain-containing protein At3g27040 n=1 Tax=Tarenaya hassleriana TaxID=28532 RepID=UPI00053C1ECC|nr:PREDICTED: MATH domain and coiled-coil domain-containing protein At3g27040 [Tarenaya hassleriana]